MSGPVVLTLAVWVGCPALIWLAGYFGDRHQDNGTAYGCCILWLVLVAAWCVQALAWIVGGPS